MSPTALHTLFKKLADAERFQTVLWTRRPLAHPAFSHDDFVVRVGVRTGSGMLLRLT